MEVRASRSVSAEHAARLERIVFAGGGPDADGLELIFAVDRYAERADRRWNDLVAKAMSLAAPGEPAGLRSPAASAA
jgi:hypothetical protein